MSNKEPIVQRFDEKLVNFYLEELYPQADLLYRLSFILTLNLDLARKCLDTVYQEITNDLAMVTNNGEIAKLILIKTCWRAFKKLGVSSMKVGQSPIALTFEGMSIEERAAVGMVDVMGLSVDEAKGVLEIEEGVLRKNLAAGRQHLVARYKV